MQRIVKYSFAAAIVLVAVISCRKTLPGVPGDNEVLDGPVAGLTHEQRKSFLAGSEFFDKVFTSETGLGPVYVAASCESCHAGDGKGHPFSTLVRFNKYDGGKYDPMVSMGGPQLQHKGLPGYPGETLPPGFTGKTSMIAPAVTGLGFIEAVEDAFILLMADSADKDGDGISGVPNWVFPPHYYQPAAGRMADALGRYIGRFGRKASNLNLLMQSVNALHEDIGITTDLRPDEVYNYQVGIGSGDHVPEPELAGANVHSLVFYLQCLKAPARRNTELQNVILGSEIFEQIDCAKCHKPALQTGNHAIAALSNKTFYPYTDLLMHDMGPELDDGYAEGSSGSAEWRTTPLWGLGLSKNSQGGNYFLLHDGRAHSLEEAIALHGGEASGSRSKFNALSTEEKSRLIQFLESL